MTTIKRICFGMHLNIIDVEEVETYACWCSKCNNASRHVVMCKKCNQILIDYCDYCNPDYRLI